MKQKECEKYLVSRGFRKVSNPYSCNGVSFQKKLILKDHKPILTSFIVGEDSDPEFKNVLDLNIYFSNDGSDYAGFTFRKLDYVKELVNILNRSKTFSNIKERMGKYKGKSYNSKI